MPPNKPRLYTPTVKPTVPPSEHNVPQPLLDSEEAQKFEVELCWCIQQLQLALSSGKLNNKQSQEYQKSLNTLMKNNAPMVKKRQIMRSSFGDYRLKMSEEDKNISKNALNMKLKAGGPSKKSVFVKKKAFSATLNDFKFNFEMPQECDLDHKHDEVVLSEHSGLETNKGFGFSCSDNSFRFHFDMGSS